MEQIEVEEFLQHHGVKGMKWGVRRSSKTGSKSSSKSKKTTETLQKLKWTDKDIENAKLFISGMALYLMRT